MRGTERIGDIRGEYADKVALVTGAASGIGRAITEGLLAEGAYVVANDLRVDGLGGLDCARLVTVAADVSAPDAGGRLVAEALSLGSGRVDALFANAGIGCSKPALEVSHADWRRVMAVNVDATFGLATAVGRVMIEQGGGAILTTSSVAGTNGLPNCAPYVVSKHAVVGMTKALAVEWGEHGVRVNALCPGLTRTGMSARLQTEAPDYWAKREALVPLRRAGLASEQAELALFLNSDRASYISGLIAEVDGGTHALYAGYTVSRPRLDTGTAG